MIKRGKRVKTISGKLLKRLGLLLSLTGIVVLLSLGYTDAYTMLKQSLLHKQWQKLTAQHQGYANTVQPKQRIMSNNGEAVEKTRPGSSIDNKANSKNNSKSNNNNDISKIKTNNEANNEMAESKNEQFLQKSNSDDLAAKHASLKPGSLFARIMIPRIGLDAVVVEGTDDDQLKLGPGHMQDTAWPGEIGNMVISGHRVTHNRPFYYLDRLKVGDSIIVDSKSKRYVYSVIEKRVVLPSDLSVIQQTDYAALTLTTCNPRFSAKTRLVVRARIVEKNLEQLSVAKHSQSRSMDN
jgi:sortase A